MMAWSIAALLLLLPLVAMQFTDEVNWTVSDFVFAMLLILSVGLPLELAVSRTGSLAYRAAVGLVLIVWFLTLWLNGAVGIIGSEDNSANVMYAGVIAIAIIGAVIARFRPGGMARAMIGAALALVAIAAIVLVTGWGSEEPVWPWPVVIINGFMAALLVAAAMLFRYAAQENARAGTLPVR